MYTLDTDPDGVGQGERDGERQSFWNGDDEHRDADDEELEVPLEVVDAPLLVLDGERFDWESQDEDEHRQYGHDHAWAINKPFQRVHGRRRRRRQDAAVEMISKLK